MCVRDRKEFGASMSAIKFTTNCGISYTGYFDSFKTEACLDFRHY